MAAYHLSLIAANQQAGRVILAVLAFICACIGVLCAAIGFIVRYLALNRGKKV